MNLLEEWQTRLGLQDWRIKLQDGCKPEDMILENVSGATQWTESVKTAYIQILGEEYYPKDGVVGYDYEKTLVHELLHLKFSLVSSECDDLQERVMHQYIDDLARALVSAKRGTEK